MNDDTYTCKRCGEGVGYVSTDGLCDGCVAEDSKSVTGRIAEALAEEWPNTFEGGFEDTVAGVAAEIMTGAPLALRAPEVSELLARNWRGEISAGDVCQALSDMLATGVSAA